MADNMSDFSRNLLANPYLEIPQDLKDKRAELDELLEMTPYFKTNVYRQLTRDACDTRHRNIEPQTLQKFCPLDNGRLSKKEWEAAGSRGLFARLPLELLVIIFVDMVDLATLTKIRSVSRGIRLMISSLPQYDAIFTYAPASLRATLSLQTAAWTSCRNLYEELCKPACVQCGDFGSFLYIPTCQRVCYYCFTNDDKFRPVPTARMKRIMGVTPKNLNDIRKIRTLPGCYNDSTLRFQWNVFKRNPPRSTSKRETYVDAEIADSLLAKIHGSKEAANYYTMLNRAQMLRAWTDKVTAWHATPKHLRPSRNPPQPKDILMSDYHENNPERHYFIVGFPWLNRAESATDWGVACCGCYKGYNGYNAERREKTKLYSKDGFLWHMLLCKESQKCMNGLRDQNPPMERKLVSMSGREKVCDVAGDKSARMAQVQDNPIAHANGPCNFWYGRGA